MQNIFIDVLPPWVETGLQPAFYDLESGTVLQQTARMYAKMREVVEGFNTFTTSVTNEVNNFENEVNETVIEYIKKFNELHDFVNDYFDNLDVQDEINNKLDQMAEDGELTEIIAQYLQLAGVLCYNTLSDLKGAENISVGSYCKIIGKSTYNDGFGRLYKVRTLVNTDVVDDNNLIALTNYPTLVGERILDHLTGDKSNPCYYGADPTGTVDSSSAINACIQANLGKSIKFTGGKYLVNSPILTPYYTDEQVNIDFNGATLYTEESLDYVLGIGYYNKGAGFPNRGNYTDAKCCYAVFENFVIEAPNSTVGVQIADKYWYARIINSSIFFTVIGVKCFTATGESSDLLLDNVYIQCSDYKDPNTRGLVIYGGDNKIINSRIYNANVGIEVFSQGNYFVNDHIYLYGHAADVSSESFPSIWATTKAFVEHNSNNFHTEVYTDSYSTHYYIDKSNYKGFFDNCMLYNNVNGYDDCCFDIHEGSIEKFTLTNTKINLGASGANGNKGIYCTNASLIGLCYETVLHNNDIYNITNDPILIDTSRPYVQPYSGGTQFSANTYYVLGYIYAPNYHKLTVSLNNYGDYTQKASFNINGSYAIGSVTNLGTSGNNVSMGGKIVEFNGLKFLEISVKFNALTYAITGVTYNVEDNGYGLGILPVGMKKYNNTFVTTTPTHTVDFA
jgi:hypothetical protein